MDSTACPHHEITVTLDSTTGHQLSSILNQARVIQHVVIVYMVQGHYFQSYQEIGVLNVDQACFGLGRSNRDTLPSIGCKSTKLELDGVCWAQFNIKEDFSLQRVCRGALHCKTEVDDSCSGIKPPTSLAFAHLPRTTSTLHTESTLAQNSLEYRQDNEKQFRMSKSEFIEISLLLTRASANGSGHSYTSPS